MSKQSRFYQVTNQILLEYSTDQYKITSVHNIVGEDAAQFYMYQGLDGNQYCIEKTQYQDADAKSINNINDAKYPDENNSTYYYGGKNITDFDITEDNSSDIHGNDIYINSNNIGTIIKNKNNVQLRIDYINHDTIKLYITTGYVMNNIAGYSLKVKGKVFKVKSLPDSEGNITVKRIEDTLTLLDWFMPKEELKNKIHWLKNPLYMNSCFYDRYIEIKFPSPLDCALNNRDIYYVYENIDDNGNTQLMYGNIEKSSNIIIEFATVQPENLNIVLDSTSTYESNFTLDVPKIFAMNYESNANNFNVRLYEDPIQHAIIYYPVYGTDYIGNGVNTGNPKAFDIATMQAIDSGAIPIIDLSSLDTINDGMDDFIEMYGDNIDQHGNVNIYKWIIINELAVTYNYSFNIESNNLDNNDQSYSEYYTNTIDYSGKTEQHGKFYETKFIPYIQERNNMTCKSIIVKYTAHLFNRLNNIDIIRTASMVITNPYKYTLTTINTNNIMQYKIVNKIDKQNIQITNNKQSLTEKMIKTYYDTTNITVKSDGNTYQQGKMTLYLHHDGNNYMFKLYDTNQDGSKIPLDLSGNNEYKITFPSISSSSIQIFPNKNSQNYNLSLGSLIFYITKDQAKAIMEVPRSERYFSIKTHIPYNNAEESVIYEGTVEWYAS